MSKVAEYLNEAFTGESQANRKYLAYAAKADQEGYPQVARLFRAAAEAETIHAHNHEFTHMYPEMIDAAKAEGHKDAERSFSYANEVEKVHAQLYQRLLDNLGGTQEDYPYYVCPVCGYTAEKEPPDTCPVCGAKGEKFKKLD
jgi:rubrerythrin